MRAGAIADLSCIYREKIFQQLDHFGILKAQE
jgi:hypothetical protein